MSNVGSIVAFGSTFAPQGYLYCDGAEYLVSDYPELYSVIANQYGGIFGQSFMVPDLRGEFLRGADMATQFPGQKQDDSTAMPNSGWTGTTSTAGQHAHGYSASGINNAQAQFGGGAVFNRNSTQSSTSSAGAHTHTVNISGGDAETRPQNMGVLYCIQAVAQAGEAGPQGPQGPMGPQGPQGIQGPPNGATGATGAQGLPGFDGADGAQGPLGATGATGIQGPMGAPGITRIQYINNPVPYFGGGPQGATGPQGPEGPAGPPNGATGATGVEGPQGAPGFGAYAHARVDEDGNFIANRGFASCGLVTTGTYRYEFAQPLADDNYSVLADVNNRQIGREAKVLEHDANGFKVFIGKSNTKPFNSPHTVIVIN